MEDSDTHEIEPLPPLRYPVGVVLPILAKDGDDDMRCRLCRSLLLPLSFGRDSEGIAPLAGLVGGLSPGDSIIRSVAIEAIVLREERWSPPNELVF